MPIKRKDGTLYKLAGPNPIMLTQERWDKSKLVFHNMKWHGKTIPDTMHLTPYSSAFRINPVAEKQQPLPPHRVEEPVYAGPPITFEEVPEPAEEVKPTGIAAKIPDSALRNRIQVWCQPAIVKTVNDSFYGDSYRTIKYGEKFIFEGIAVENDDITYSIWTTVPHVTVGSILYPRSEEKRWWRVSEVKEKTGGYLITSVITNYQVSFGSHPQ